MSHPPYGELSRWRRAAVVGVLASGLVVPAVLLSTAAPAGAQVDFLYAYASGGASSPASCPETDVTADQCTLEEALSLASGGDTIELATPGATAAYVGNWTIGQSGTSASAPVTIEPGPGVSDPILNGNYDGSSVLVVQEFVYFDLSGVTVENGSSSAYLGAGGGIANVGGSLTVADSTFIDDSANSFGGAISNGFAGSIVVSDSTFTDDSSGYEGGAISNDGGALSVTDFGVDSGSFTVTASTFTDDSAAFGGAIDNGGGSTATTTVTASTFTDDSASEDGGAIDNGLDGFGALTVTASTFTDDSASEDGGAIDNADQVGYGTATVTASTFTDDSAVTDGGIIDNGDNGVPGASFDYGFVVTTGDILDGSCANALNSGEGAYFDGGYNASIDTSCGGGGLSDVVSSDVGRLSALGNNGGPTETILPTAGNPAIGLIPSGIPSLCPTTDQRGVASPSGQPCDAGSVQAIPSAVVDAVAPTDTTLGTNGAPVEPATGGNVVTVEGSGFCGGATAPCSPVSTSVSFVNQATGESYAGTDVNVSTDSVLDVTEPTDLPYGAYDVIVTVNGEASSPSTNPSPSSDEVDIVPDVTAISPNGGPLSGGNPVTLTGAGFIDPSTNTSDVTSLALVSGKHSVPIDDYSVVSDTEIDISAMPALSAKATYSLAVGTALYSPGLSGASYIYESPVSISSTSTSVGVVNDSNGPTMTVRGRGFVPGTSVMSVAWSLDGTTTYPTVSCASTTSCSFVVPEDSTPGDVASWTIGDVQATSAAETYTYTSSPDITSVSASTGPVGDSSGPTMTVNGTGFSSGVTSLYWGGVEDVATVSCSATSCSFTVPTRTAAGAVSWYLYNYTTTIKTATQSYRYEKPSITLVSPKSEPVGSASETITVTGTNFVNGVTSLYWGGVEDVATVSCSAASCSFTVPTRTAAGAVSWYLYNYTTTIKTATQSYTYEGPSISSVSPKSGPVGSASETITVTGTNFVNGVTSLYWDGSANPASVSCSSISCSFTVPTETSNGKASWYLYDDDAQTKTETYTYEGPSISSLAAATSSGSVSATSGVVDGPVVTMTVTGENFVSGVTTVSWTFDDTTSLLAATCSSSNTCTFTVPTETSNGKASWYLYDDDAQTKTETYTYKTA